MTSTPASYNGIALILDQANRHDGNGLLGGMAGQWFEEACLHPFKKADCYINTIDAHRKMPDGTTHVALLGDKACKAFSPNYVPGYPIISGFGDRPLYMMPMFNPQDACDPVNIEYASSDDDDDDVVSDIETKDYYPTRRRNYRLWNEVLMAKLLRGPTVKLPRVSYEVVTDGTKLGDLLALLHDTQLYIDIETSMKMRSISCIGLTWTGMWPHIFVVPIYDYKDQITVRNLNYFIAGLFKAFRRNEVVAHNAMFDLTVLCGFYNMPIPKSIYCTMVSQHRICVEGEKSLSHAIAMHTWLPFHKLSSTEVYNHEQQAELYKYNASDVYALFPIRQSQLSPDYLSCFGSVKQANRSLRPYLKNQLRGLIVNRKKWGETEREKQKLLNQYKRIIDILYGSAEFNPTSPKQCSDFFHNKLGYKPTGRTPTGAPKLGRKQLYLLQLANYNPLIRCIIAYRELAKDLSMLTSQLWDRRVS